MSAWEQAFLDDLHLLPYDGTVLETEYREFQWEIAPDFKTLLPEVLRQPGEPIKTSSATTVTRHRLAGREFYVKRYLHERRGLAPLAYFVRASKSRREWKWAARMRQRGVAVVPHLAHGERWSWRGLLGSTLITEGLPGYVVLRSLGTLSSPELQFALGRFLRRVHDAGVLHLDITPKNILYSAAGHEFCLMDVDKVVCRNKLSREERTDNLVSLAARVPLTARFYEGYGSDVAFDAEEIAQLAQARWHIWMTQISRRWRKHTHEIDRQQVGELHWYVRTALADEHLRRLMENPEAFCVNGIEGLTVRRFGLGAARRAYQEAYRQELLGQTRFRPVAVGEKRVWGVCLRSYFVATT